MKKIFFKLSMLSEFLHRFSAFVLRIFSKPTAQGSRHKASLFRTRHMAHGMLVLLFFSVMLIQSGCSLFGYYKIERFLGTNSICWEDNDHILIYTSIAEYHMVTSIGGQSKQYDWVGGEIWRITASTGAKELLFRSKDSHYVYSIEGVHMDAVNGHIYVNDAFNTYRIVEPYDEWEQLIDSVVYPVVSADEKYIVAMRHGGDAIKYDMTNKTIEVLLTDAGPVSDYDYERNYLLINSNKFVDLNTGEEVIVCESGDSIEEYVVSYDNMAKGSIEENYLTMDVSVYNVADISKDYRYRLKIDINDFNDKYLVKNVNGTLSPDKKTYAVSGLFTDTLGDTISQWSMPFDEL